jgi:NAD(P)-dependent dehydrogenase (short-subunit alcohol dehydrogenase family)
LEREIARGAGQFANIGSDAADCRLRRYPLPPVETVGAGGETHRDSPKRSAAHREHDLGEADFDRTIEVNSNSMFLCTQALPAIQHEKWPYRHAWKGSRAATPRDWQKRASPMNAVAYGRAKPNLLTIPPWCVSPQSHHDLLLIAPCFAHA